jgi:hypothetical protein
MKLLVVSLDHPENSLYIKPEKAGIYLLGRQIKRYPLFAVDDERNITPIVLTSAEISMAQKEVDEQLEALK